jgi:hypothetical protein
MDGVRVAGYRRHDPPADMFDLFERVHRESGTASIPIGRTIPITNPQHSFGETT